MSKYRTRCSEGVPVSNGLIAILSLILILLSVHIVLCSFTDFELFVCCISVPSPGQLSQRVQSVGNFPTITRHPIKATAYVSPTVQQSPTATPLSISTSLHSIPSSAALPQPLKLSSSFLPQPQKVSTNQPAAPRSSLPRPASFVGISGVPRASKISQATRR